MAVENIYLPPILRLPDELKLSIIDYIHRRRDLFNLGLTCRTFESVTHSSLYRDVSVEIPPDNTLAWNLGGLPLLRDDVIHSMESLTIQNGYADIRYPAYDRKQKHYGSLELLAHHLLCQMPSKRLWKMAFLHQTPTTGRVLNALFDKQSSSLKELLLLHMKAPDLSLDRLPKNLETFECRSWTDGEQIGKILQSSSESLRKLRLGQEKMLVQTYIQNNLVSAGQEYETLDQIFKALPLCDLTNLRELDLYGTNVLLVLPQSTVEINSFIRLERLALESCSGTSELLEILSTAFETAKANSSFQIPKLRELSIRYEAPNDDFRSNLSAFLASFQGLEKLSLLFENASFAEKPATLLRGHGSTLKELVLECRIEPRLHLSHDTSRPFGIGGYTQNLWEDTVQDICQLCPNLEELGTGFPWSDETVRLRAPTLSSLRSLRTVHIRNFPASTQVIQFGDYAIKQFAMKFLDWTFSGFSGDYPPPIETLAIGPTLYESRWKANISRGPLPEYLKTHFFCVDWHRNRFGQWLPLVTGVTQKCIESQRDEHPLGGVFEKFWLM